MKTVHEHPQADLLSLQSRIDSLHRKVDGLVTVVTKLSRQLEALTIVGVQDAEDANT